MAQESIPASLENKRAPCRSDPFTLLLREEQYLHTNPAQKGINLPSRTNTPCPWRCHVTSPIGQYSAHDCFKCSAAAASQQNTLLAIDHVLPTRNKKERTSPEVLRPAPLPLAHGNRPRYSPHPCHSPTRMSRCPLRVGIPHSPITSVLFASDVTVQRPSDKATIRPPVPQSL
jgi:hypothetical protein